VSATKRFCREHPELIFTRADQGNTMMVLNRNDYLWEAKMETILSDTSTNEMIKMDPIKELTNDLKTLLTRWKNNEIIDTYR